MVTSGHRHRSREAQAIILRLLSAEYISMNQELLSLSFSLSLSLSLVLIQT